MVVPFSYCCNGCTRRYLEAYKVELLMRRYNEEQGEGGEGGDGDFPSKRPRMDAAAFAGCAPVLKQLAPRKHAGQAAAAAAARQAAAAAAGTASKASPSPEPGPTAREGFWLDNTPRPADLASQAVLEHDLAPKGGERGNANRQEVPRQQGAPPPVKHYMSGVLGGHVCGGQGRRVLRLIAFLHVLVPALSGLNTTC